MTKIQNYKKVPDIIADALRDGILRGTLEGGLQLKQDEIAKKFDVSLIPVREALIQLEAKGLVTSIRNKGAVVTPLSLEEMNMIFELRRILETGAAKIISDRIQPQKIDELKHLMTQMEKENDIYTFNHFNTVFHQMLFDSTENVHLSETYRTLFVRVERYCMYILSQGAIIKKIKEDHKEIISYIEQKKYEQLSDKLRDHIDESQVLFAEHVIHKCDLEELNWNSLLHI
jgi:DNA-binding GntR family transcriptional regulator